VGFAEIARIFSFPNRPDQIEGSPSVIFDGHRGRSTRRVIWPLTFI